MVAYAAVTAVAANVDADLAVKLDVSVAEILAAIWTHSQSKSHNHSH